MPSASSWRHFSLYLAALVGILAPMLMPWARELYSKTRTPLLLCLFSRLALFTVAFLGLAAQPKVEATWRAFPHNLLLDGWLRWDAGWYFRIASEGYTPIPHQLQQPANFFPLYPLLVRGLGQVLGDYHIAGLVLSNGCLLIACALLYRYLTRAYDELIATRAVTLLLAYPFAFHFSAMYSESLFLLGVVSAFYFAQKQRWLLASLAVAAAGATRVVGVVALVALLVMYLERHQYRLTQIRPDVLWLSVGLLGVLGYVLFCAVKFNDPFLFLKTQWVPGWGEANNLRNLGRLLRRVFDLRRFTEGRFDSIPFMNLLFGTLALVLSAVGWRRLGPGPTVWALLTMLISLRLWSASGRYAAVVWPVFVWLALVTRGRELVYQSLLTFLTLLQALYLFLFAHGKFLG